MVSHDQFLSSPKRVQMKYDSHAISSSSPELPPLHDILSQRYRKSPLKAGSRSAPIPLDAETGFQSASSLYAAAKPRALSREVTNASLQDSEQVVVLQDWDQSLDNCKGKPKTKSGRVEGPLQDVAKHGRPEPPISPSKDEPWRQFKGRKKASGSNHLTQHDIGPVDTGLPSKAGKTTSETSRHFVEASASYQPSKTEAKVEERVVLDLEPAMTRRTDWTPPKPSAPTWPKSDAVLLSQPGTSSDADAHSGFANLLADYKFTEVGMLRKQSDVVYISDEDAKFLKKRKRIDVVDISKAGTRDTLRAPSGEVSPTKQKTSKKKTRTLTDLATEAYKMPDSAEPSMLDSFLAPAEPEATAQDETARGKGKGKGKSIRAPRLSKKKAVPPPPVLLSPTAALRQAAQQDILFGTSSQLAHEKSPTFLKDLQKAMKLSMEVKNDPFETPLNSDGIEAPQHRTLKLWEAAARDEDGSLFDIEMVDLANGSLPLPLSDHADDDPFGYKLPELVSSTERGKQQGVENLGDAVTSVSRVPTTAPALLGREDAATGDMTDESGPGQLVKLFESFSDSEISVSSNIRESHFQNNNAVQHATGDSDMPPAITATKPLPRDPSSATVLPRPNFEAYTDARLSNELRKFGFKPVKRRTAMITLLDQCWQSQQGAPGNTLGQIASLSTSSATAHPRPRASSPTKNKAPAAPVASTAAQNDESTVKRSRGRPRKQSVAEIDSQVPPPSAQPPETPKRARGRPRKEGSPSTSQALTKPMKTQAESPRKKNKASSRKKASPKRTKPAGSNVIEIPDSASELGSDTTISRSASPEPTFSSPEAVDLSLSLAEDTEFSLSMSPNQEQTALFSSITQAVKSAPRTTDPKNPSWHEKMLMYDPIVIEDLTAWLNAGQLTKVGYDAEVKPAVVKKWCESKSVCCLWKVNLRGKERKRY